MNSAYFLLIINMSLGICFALAFAALSYREKISLGFYVAIGFLAASSTVGVEALERFIPYPRLSSSLSFSFFMIAVTSICIGTFRHYRKDWSVKPVLVFALLCILAYPFITYPLPRDGFARALAYQTPFALICVAAAMPVLVRSPVQIKVSDYALAFVLVVSGLQFLAKAFLALTAESGPSASGYIYSKYAFYSQTAGTILSLALGVALLTVIAHESLIRMRRAMQCDALSGLWNRGAFFEHVSEAFRQHGAKGHVILCDLDVFKSINDRFGHAAGDEVIRTFGDVLKASQTNNHPICGRIGGEEFAIFIAGEQASNVPRYVETLQHGLSQQRFPFMPDVVTASYGIAAILPHETIDQALARADAALYRAKTEGRDTYRLATP